MKLDNEKTIKELREELDGFHLNEAGGVRFVVEYLEPFTSCDGSKCWGFVCVSLFAPWGDIALPILTIHGAKYNRHHLAEVLTRTRSLWCMFSEMERKGAIKCDY